MNLVHCLLYVVDAESDRRVKHDRSWRVRASFHVVYGDKPEDGLVVVDVPRRDVVPQFNRVALVRIVEEGETVPRTINSFTVTNVSLAKILVQAGVT